MIARFIIICAAAGFILVHNASAQTQPATECDELAASPEDPYRNAAGIELSNINAKAAVPACESAVEVAERGPAAVSAWACLFKTEKKSAAEHCKKQEVR